METRANPNSHLFTESDSLKEADPHAQISKGDMRTRGGLIEPIQDQRQDIDTSPPPKSKRDLRGFGKELEKFSSQQEKNLANFYNYQIFHPRFLQVIVFILGIAGIITCLILTLQFFKSRKPIEPIYTKIEGIKRLGEMHLVKHKYESVIPITKKKEKRGELKKETLQFLLIAPIEVSGYIDLSKLILTLEKDSLIRIQLPKAKVSKAYLDFSRTEEFRAEGKLKIFGNYIENINHKEAYFDIAKGINEAKARVRTTAEQKHEILKETHFKAETFLRNFVSTIGYRVEFMVEGESPLESNTDAQKNSVL